MLDEYICIDLSSRDCRHEMDTSMKLKVSTTATCLTAYSIIKPNHTASLLLVGHDKVNMMFVSAVWSM